MQNLLSQSALCDVDDESYPRYRDVAVSRVLWRVSNDSEIGLRNVTSKRSSAIMVTWKSQYHALKKPNVLVIVVSVTLVTIRNFTTRLVVLIRSFVKDDGVESHYHIISDRIIIQLLQSSEIFTQRWIYALLPIVYSLKLLRIEKACTMVHTF